MGQNPASKGKKTHEGIHVKGILEFRDQPKNSRKKGEISWVPSFVSVETRTLPSRGVQAIGRSESLFRKEQGGFLGHFQGLATNLHGVGSVLEKMAALPGLGVLAPKAIFFGALPRGRGGLCTPARKASRQPQHYPLLGHRLIVNAPVGMRCLGLSPALACGRGDRVPPRKTPLASSRGPPPQGHPSSDSPPRGGAGSARPQGWLGPNRYMSPLGPRVIFEACGGNEMPGLAFGLTTRARRPRPSEKTPSASSPIFPARPSMLG